MKMFFEKKFVRKYVLNIVHNQNNIRRYI